MLPKNPVRQGLKYLALTLFLLMLFSLDAPAASDSFSPSSSVLVSDEPDYLWLNVTDWEGNLNQIGFRKNQEGSIAFGLDGNYYGSMNAIPIFNDGSYEYLCEFRNLAGGTFTYGSYFIEYSGADTIQCKRWSAPQQGSSFVFTDIWIRISCGTLGECKIDARGTTTEPGITDTGFSFFVYPEQIQTWRYVEINGQSYDTQQSQSLPIDYNMEFQDSSQVPINKYWDWVDMYGPTYTESAEAIRLNNIQGVLTAVTGMGASQTVEIDPVLIFVGDGNISFEGLPDYEVGHRWGFLDLTVENDLETPLNITPSDWGFTFDYPGITWNVYTDTLVEYCLPDCVNLTEDLLEFTGSYEMQPSETKDFRFEYIIPESAIGTQIKYNVTFMDGLLDPYFTGNGTNFDNGTYYQTYLNPQGYVELNSSFDEGWYLSEVIDAGQNASWDNITFSGYGGNYSTLANTLDFDMSHSNSTWLLYDISPYANHGTIFFVNCDAPGPLGSGIACDFPGKSGVQNSYVSVTSDPAFALSNNFAISACIKPSSTQNDTETGVISNNDMRYGFTYNVLNTRVDVYGNGAMRTSSSSGSVPSDKWTLVTVEYTNPGGMLIYVDGVVAATDNFKNAITTHGTLYLGKSGGATDDHYNGSMDNIRIWNRTLTSTEHENLAAECLEANLNVSVRSCDDAACSGESWNDTYLDFNTLYNLTVADNRYCQYNVTFGTENTSYVPYLSEVVVGYVTTTTTSTTTSTTTTTTLPAVWQTYMIDDIQTTTGTYVSGDNESTWRVDTNYYTVNETNGTSPAMVIDFTFNDTAGLPAISWNFSVWYDGDLDHQSIFRLYNYDDLNWDDIISFNGTGGFVTKEGTILDATDYTTSDIQGRFVHTTVGEPNETFYLDYFRIENFTPPTSCLEDDDCLTTQFCNSTNYCQPQLGDGQPCSRTRMCINYCVNGTCGSPVIDMGGWLIPPSTNVSDEPDLENVSVFLSNAWCSINWTSPLDLSESADFANGCRCEKHWINCDTSILPGIIGVEAELTHKNTDFTGVLLSGILFLKEGVSCGGDCYAKSKSSDEVYETVTHFTNFSIGNFSSYSAVLSNLTIPRLIHQEGKGSLYFILSNTLGQPLEHQDADVYVTNSDGVVIKRFKTLQLYANNTFQDENGNWVSDVPLTNAMGEYIYEFDVDPEWAKYLENVTVHVVANGQHSSAVTSIDLPEQLRVGDWVAWAKRFSGLIIIYLLAIFGFIIFIGLLVYVFLSKKRYGVRGGLV